MNTLASGHSDNTKVIGAIVHVLTSDGKWHIARFEKPDVLANVERDSVAVLFAGVSALPPEQDKEW